MRSLERERRLYRTGTEKGGISMLSGTVMGVATKNLDTGIIAALMANTTLIGIFLLQELSVDRRMGKHRKYNLGQFGTIYGTSHRGNTVKLDDGVVIQPGDIVGHIDLSKNLASSLSQSQFTGVFLRSFSYAMVRLANDVEHKRLPKQMKAITGTSHLARPTTCARLGFTVTDEGELIRKFVAAKYGVDLTRDYDTSEPYLRLFKREWNHVHQVWMSRDQIVASKPLFQDLRRRLKNSKSFKALTA